MLCSKSDKEEMSVMEIMKSAIVAKSSSLSNKGSASLDLAARAGMLNLEAETPPLVPIASKMATKFQLPQIEVSAR
jgi:hypothetical protein